MAFFAENWVYIMNKKCVLPVLAVLMIPLFCVAAFGADAVKNLAFEADYIYASSEFSAGYAAYYVADGIVRNQDMRLPNWITNYKKEGTLTFTWDREQVIEKAVFYDLSALDSHVVGGRITINGEKQMELGALNNNGSPKEIIFDEPIHAKTIELYVIGSSETQAVGLSEVELYDTSGNNVAPEAAVSANSEMHDGSPYWFIPAIYEGWYAAENVVNGWADSTLPVDSPENEWASAGEAYPEITIGWDKPVSVGTVVLYDRIGSEDCVWAGEISFDKGEIIYFDGIDNNGDPCYVDIPDVLTTSVTITVTDSAGPNIGFAEIEVFTEHFDENRNVMAISSPMADKIGNADAEGEFNSDDESPESGKTAYPNVGPLSIVLLGIFAFLILLAAISVFSTKKVKNLREDEDYV